MNYLLMLAPMLLEWLSFSANLVQLWDGWVDWKRDHSPFNRYT